MTHFLWSLFFLGCSVVTVSIYIGSAISVLFMMHYIVKHDWRRISESWPFHECLIRIVWKFFVYLLIPTIFAACYIWVEAKFHNSWVPYIDSEYAIVFNRAVLILLAGFVTILFINVRVIGKQQQASADIKKYKFSTYYKSHLAKILVIFVLSSMLTVYIGQRQKWTGADNTHLKAKEYWVAGQVLQGFRMLLTTVIHPGLCLMTPLNSLQRLIFDKGLEYLPENDGEKEIWENAWFYYHYHRLNRIAFKTIDWRPPSPATIDLLDKWWRCLESMATKTYGDKQMEEEHYYQDYVNLALSYSAFEGIYSGNRVGSNPRMAQDPIHVERSRKLSRWLTELREKWQSTEKSRKLLAEFPKMEVMCQYVMLSELKDVIQGEIYSREFDCANPTVLQYLALRKEFTEPATGRPAYKRMKDRVAADTLYDWAINSQMSTKYVLEHYCRVKVAGKEDFSKYESWANNRNISAAMEAQSAAKSNYTDEIKILEDLYYGDLYPQTQSK